LYAQQRENFSSYPGIPAHGLQSKPKLFPVRP
jgi:hypothetical protein